MSVVEECGKELYVVGSSIGLCWNGSFEYMSCCLYVELEVNYGTGNCAGETCLC